jgi:hypothetical protein
VVRPSSFRRGVALGLFVSESDPEARRFYYEQLLDEIAEVGATDVAIVVRWVQSDVTATEIGPTSGVTVADAVVTEVVGLARVRGLRVFLLPTLHVESRRRGDWRGSLRPDDWNAWWRSYYGFVLHYASLAATAEVDMLAVGSELVSTERYVERWRDLIQQVRVVYPGRLTYAANWDHFEPVQFWDAVDVAAVSVYPGLSDEDDPDQAALVEGWTPFRRRLRAWAAQHNQRYLFAEVGYPSHRDAARRPWDYGVRGSPDPQLQARCYRSLYEVWQGDDRLDGLFLWNWFGTGGPDDVGYTPRGKPAEDVVRYWYTGSVATTPPSD